MVPVGEPMSGSVGRTGQISVAHRTRVRAARAANDNQPIHAAWRRVVAAGMAVLFAASLILVGLVCIARADETVGPFIIGN